jgi:glycosyltransferase involved in cell wall biosynthesis
MQRQTTLPPVSIIVPAYNEEKHIRECLTSLKNQSYPPEKIEILCVDDGSLDHTKQIAGQYAHTVLSQKHQGPDRARNYGASKSQGDILIFIDADMYVDKNYVEYITEPIIKNNTDATFTKEEHVANFSNIWSRCYQIDNNLPLDSRIRTSQGNTDMRFRAILKKTFVAFGGFIPDIGYDGDRTVKTVKAISAPHAICYHYNPDSLSEVFLSARWVGRSKSNQVTWRNIFRYSIINSMVISVRKMYQGAPFAFLLYKIIFDFGFLCGIIWKNSNNSHSK